MGDDSYDEDDTGADFGNPGSEAFRPTDLPGTEPGDRYDVAVDAGGDVSNVAVGDRNAVGTEGQTVTGDPEGTVRGQNVSSDGSNAASKGGEVHEDYDVEDSAMYDSEAGVSDGSGAGEPAVEDDSVDTVNELAEAYGIDEGRLDAVVALGEEAYGVGDAVEEMLSGVYDEFAGDGEADTGAVYADAAEAFAEQGMSEDEVDQYMTQLKTVVSSARSGPANSATTSLEKVSLSSRLPE